MQNDILSAIKQVLDDRLGDVSTDYVDIQGASFILGVAKSTVHKLNFRNAIPYFKPDGSKKCYYKKSDLIEYMTKNRFKSKQEIYEEASRLLKEKKGQNHV